ncbi:MAG: HAD family hydrolase [Capnocytophaga sp.]|nr:HAD family hydrolase [Capnocytophaga sp.]
MIKLIVSDIDGTLVNNKKELPNNFWKVYDLIQEKNIRFCVASGRQIQSLEQLFQPIAHEIGFASDNGALVRFQNKDLYEIPLEINSIMPILEVCEQIPNAGTVVCGKNKAYIKTDFDNIFEEIALYYPAHQRIENFSDIKDSIFKISVCDKRFSRLNSYPKLERFSNEFNVVISGDLWLDITDKNVNKGVALKALQNLWNISEEETLVFGDQLNDIEMMQGAKFSYAMKNAQDEVKKVASFITDYDNNNEGVIRKIEELLSQI